MGLNKNDEATSVKLSPNGRYRLWRKGATKRLMPPAWTPTFSTITSFNELANVIHSGKFVTFHWQILPANETPKEEVVE